MKEMTWQDELLFDVHASIENGRWTVVHVMADPPWAYTVGLAIRFDHPELAVVGVDSESAHRLLNDIGDRIADGARLAPGDSLTVGEGFTVGVGSVHNKHWECGRFAVWVNYHGSRGAFLQPRALQILWPDDDGHPYGDPRFSKRLKRLQRLLSLPPREDW